jgi:hypothetical protein
MRFIDLKGGYRAIVDDEDYEFLSQSNWSRNNKGYACKKVRINGKPRNCYMHRVLLNAQKGESVDHINGNRLDNRRENMRLATVSQNAMNRALSSRGNNRYKGVSLHKGKYEAKIRFNKKYIYLGRHVKEEEAAKAYNEAAKKYFGEYARLNQI